MKARAMLLALMIGGAACGQASSGVFDGSIGGVIIAPLPLDAMARGHLVFEKWCAGCHAPDYAHGKASPMNSALGTYTLRQKYGASMQAALEQRTDLNGDIIETYVRNGVNLMPPFRKTEISNADLSDLIAYLSRKNPGQ